ncbi:MAG: ParB/RepB/Spo0J family partition protein, partial [Spiroplasma sp.]|nr:ParB/RepB/Spo0J family partition protein [Mycoplasmatales bacterium]
SNPYQPRKIFNEEALIELSNSIKEQGVFQPILIRSGIVGYELIAGERRLRAAKLAGLKEIPAVVYDYDDKQMMEVALIENIQREDLTIVEEAKSYKMIIEHLGITQEELGKKVGKSRPHISNTLRILNLNTSILNLLDSKKITMGHVKVLVTIEDEKRVKKIVDEIIEKGLSVREAENLAKEEKPPVKQKEIIDIPRNKRLEKHLREKIGTKVKITGSNKGIIEISFSTEDDLGRILELLKLV